MKELFVELARLICRISREQEKIKIRTHGDYHSLFLGNVLNGVKIGKGLDNLAYFATKEESKSALDSLREKFTEAGVIDYRLMSSKLEHRNEEWEQAYLAETFRLLALRDVMSFAEASKLWGLGESTLRKAKFDGRFRDDEIRQSGSTWLVTRQAMERLYGKR